MIKRFISLILVLILVFALSANAFAAGKPKITKQPATATVKTGGTVKFQIKTSGTVDSIIWHFIDPATGKDYTGRKIADAVKGLKVGNPNGSTITLKKVPESMHGWTVYAHVNGNGYHVDSDKVLLLISGMDKPGADTLTLNSVSFAKKEVIVKEKVGINATTSLSAVKLTMYLKDKEVKSWTKGYSDDGDTRTWKVSYAFSGAGENRTLSFKAFDKDGSSTEAMNATVSVKKETAVAASQPESKEQSTTARAETATEEEQPARPITVNATSKILKMLDATGHASDEVPSSSLEFMETGNVLVVSDVPIISWSLNGLRIQPAEPVTEIRIMNVTADLTIDIKTSRTSVADYVVDETKTCRVTCKGCTFTYVRGNLKSATEGNVPSGAPISIMADSSDLAKNGYRINDGEPENLGLAGFQFVVTEDVEIICGE